MRCQTVSVPGGTAVVCTDGRAAKLCVFCRKANRRVASSRLCDHEVAPGKTCDAALCLDHAQRVGTDRDLCPDHAAPTSSGAFPLERLVRIYEGSDGTATQGLYGELMALGPAGVVATNLFRAQKCSARAKDYRGGNARGSYRDQAYQRKQWSMDNLGKALAQHDARLGIAWGWKRDPAQAYHVWVLYIDLPDVGQVSFHTDRRGTGPDYAGAWDGVRGASPDRILRWIAGIETSEVKV